MFNVPAALFMEQYTELFSKPSMSWLSASVVLRVEDTLNGAGGLFQAAPLLCDAVGKS